MRSKTGGAAGWGGGSDRDPINDSSREGTDLPHPTRAFLVRLKASEFCPYNPRALVANWGLEYAAAWLDFLEAEERAGRIRPRAGQEDVSRGGLYRWCLDQGEWPPVAPPAPVVAAPVAVRVVSFDGRAEPEAARLWAAAADGLREDLSRPNFDTWLAGLVGLRVKGSTLVLGAESSSSASWVRSRLLSLVRKRVSRVAGREMEVEIVALAGEVVG